MDQIQTARGDLLSCQVEALVNTVNTQGVMGKGLALQFKRAYPDNERAYVAACKRGEVQIGRVFVFDRGPISMPRYILNFPTKKHWRHPSKLEYIRDGLIDLIRIVREYGIRSLAIPPLGAGNGKLEWADVQPLIEQAFAGLEGVQVVVFEPQPEAHHNLEPSAAKPKLTPGRAALIKLFGLYGALGETLGRLEAQKLAYFLQVAGLDLRLAFIKQQYGPYAENLNHVLQRLEGHYLFGYGDRNTRSAMHLRRGAMDEAIGFLADHPDADEAATRASELIKGFETPYGLELLATVHWAMNTEGATDLTNILRVLHGWNARKQRFPEPHLRAAWDRLKQHDWVDA
jgi:O-acetyl-ADP-ribose deacetylase (regulator of RNase III)